MVAFTSNRAQAKCMSAVLEERIRKMTPVAAPPEERSQVADLFRLLDRASKVAPVCRLIGSEGESIPIPEAAFYIFERVAEVLARGDSITIVPVGQELTTQQAADLLNVSRQYLVRLLNENRIPYSKTGKHRRLKIEHVLAFKDARDKGRNAALDELTQLSEEFGGYGELK